MFPRRDANSAASSGIDRRPPTRTLVARVAGGDPDTIGEVYQRFGTALYRIARRLATDDADAEDTVHDVFVGLPRAVQSFDGHGSFEGWLKRITIRTALMKLRGERTHQRLSGRLRVGSQMRSNGRPLVDTISLEVALNQLPSSWRAVFSLKLEGYSHREIGRMVDISESASKMRFHRAIRRLHTLLGDH